MFEDSTFASTGRIRARSRAGAIAAIAVESAALLSLVLFPLIYPSVLPSRFASVLIEPPLREVHPPQQQRAQSAPATHSEINIVSISAPTVIPHDPVGIVDTPGPQLSLNPGDLMANNGVSSGTGNSPFGAAPAVRMAPAAPRGPLRVPSRVVSGMIIEQSLPQYPRIAVVTRTQGTVMLAAVISRTGEIENLRVVSGPAMLQQAALDAVRTWRYRPYLLNGEPVDVETTINVVFKLDE
jgi:periplasmic protein TonB